VPARRGRIRGDGGEVTDQAQLDEHEQQREAADRGASGRVVDEDVGAAQQRGVRRCPRSAAWAPAGAAWHGKHEVDRIVSRRDEARPEDVPTPHDNVSRKARRVLALPVYDEQPFC